MRNVSLARALAVCGVTLIAGSLAFAGDNWVGTWKLNAAKSKYSPGPAPKAQTLTFQAAPEGIKVIAESVNAEGQANKGGYTSKFDGKDVPMAANANADTTAPRRVDDNTYTSIWKKAGKVTITTKAVVSADGKTLTITRAGTDAQGRPENTTAVYDKQ